MLELLTEWLPLFLAGFATGAVLAARVRARRDRAAFALELHATQRVVATTYLSQACNADAAASDPVVHSLANLVVLDWLTLDDLPADSVLLSRVRIDLQQREVDRRIEGLRALAAKLHASMRAMHRTTVQDY